MSTSCKLSSNYKNRVIQELESFPNKTIFTEFEDELIKKYYYIKGSKALAKVLGKRRDQIVRRAQTLDIRRPK